MEIPIFLIVFGSIQALIGLFAALFFSRTKDIYILYLLFFTEFIFWEFIDLPLDPIQIITPVIFFAKLFSNKISKVLKPKFLSIIWPFYAYFFIAFLWFIKVGLLPNFISNNLSSNGNFTLFYNMYVNFCLLLIPVLLKVNFKELENLFRNLFILITIQLFLATFRQIYPDLYLPFLMTSSFGETLGYAVAENTSRNSVVSLFSYYLIFLTLFFIKSRFKYVYIFLFLIINLVFGGGRIELISSLFLIFLYINLIKNRKNILSKSLNLFKVFIPVVIVIFLGFNFLLPQEQKDRFSEITNIQSSDEFDSENDNVRISMWLYAIEGFKKSPLIGNGISKYNRVVDFSSVAVRNVSIGGAHHTYLSILYSFGFFAFLFFIIGNIKVLKNLNKSRFGNIVLNFIFLYILVEFLVRFNLGGGVKKINFLYYILMGLAISYVCNNPLKKKIK